MKKNIISAMIALSSVISISSTAFAEIPIRVTVGGEYLDTDVEPIIVEERTMLPLRAVFEAIDADVEWVDEERKVIATKGDKTVEFVIDSNIMKINGEEKEIDVPAMIVEDRTLIPLRACAEAFDLKVEWNDKTRTAKVRKAVSLESEMFGNEKLHPVITKYEYDENGNLIYEKNSEGIIVEKYAYDENGNLVYQENAGGEWEEYTYDENGLKTQYERFRNQQSFWEKYTYDENGNLIHQEDSYGDWTEYTYDREGHLIYLKSGYDQENLDGKNDQYWIKYRYDDAGNMILCEYSSGYWQKYTYDENGNEISYESSEGIWYKKFYNDKNKLTYLEHCEFWEKYTYDENGNLIYFEDSDDNWKKYTYNEDGNLIYMEDDWGNHVKYIIMEI